MGEVARVQPHAGDAGPYLDRFSYELLGFEPEFDQLPACEDYRKRKPERLHLRHRSEAYWADPA